MKYLLIYLLSFPCLTVCSYPQQRVVSKPIVDSLISLKLSDWPSTVFNAISNDGNYIIYTKKNVPKIGENVLMVRSTRKSWERAFNNASLPKFTANSKMLVFKLSKDSLCFLTLATNELRIIPNIRSFQLSREKNNESIAYLSKDSAKVTLRKINNTGAEQQFYNVTDYQFNQKGTIFVFRTEMRSKGDTVQQLHWVDLITSQPSLIWRGKYADNGTFDNKGQQFLFTTQSKNGRTLWLYTTGANAAKVVIDGVIPGIDTSLTLNNTPPFFSRDGNHIFFDLIEKKAPHRDPNAVKIDVWSYKNELQSAQMDRSEHLRPQTFAAVYNLRNNRAVRLQYEGEEINSYANRYNEEFAIVYKHNFDFDGTTYRPPHRPLSIYMVFYENGLRKLVKKNITWSPTGQFRYSSPDGRWLVYYNVAQNNYYSYDPLRDLTRNISKAIPVSVTPPYEKNAAKHKYIPVLNGAEIAGWLKNNKSILIYDEYDIWRVDPLAIKAPVNITNGYGRKHHIVLRLVEHNRRCRDYLSPDTTLLVSAFNKLTKYDGFCKITLNKVNSPSILGAGPWYMRGQTSALEVTTIVTDPTKAADTDDWLISRQSFNSAQNFYLTKDFKHYQKLSDFQPQKTYNWLTAELIHWRKLDGAMGTGILYKPENFDVKKKYPVIFQYYQHLSNTLYFYLNPSLAATELNIPFMVSRGYVVCVPDIEYKIGAPGASVVNCVVSAAIYLSKKSWVDSKRMGLNGHSYGGYETNYLITHSNLFTAAAEGAGESDFISGYGSFYAVFSRQFQYETGQDRIGSNLWERPDLYIKNSPIFQLNKVTTPLLMMHNNRDDRVPFTQAIELFTGLRRLGKRAWLLQYDDGGHNVIENKDQKDYTIRLLQFFDHYLKGSPPPKWMTEGISARMKGIDDGLALDTSGKQP